MPVTNVSPAKDPITAASYANLKKAERLRLTVWEPNGHVSARFDHRGNYEPTPFAGEVEEVLPNEKLPTLRVRWHLYAALGYDTAKGTVSTLIHIANGVWLETRKRPRNVMAVIERISEEEYNEMLKKAATLGT